MSPVNSDVLVGMQHNSHQARSAVCATSGIKILGMDASAECRVQSAECRVHVGALRDHDCLRAQVATSQLLKRVFATVLATGNALNAGTAHGDADGFRLETLQKLGGVKVRICADF